MVCIYVAHIAALVSSCTSFALMIWSRRWDGEVGVLSIFCWTFSFISSLSSLLLENSHHSVRLIFLRNISKTISSYAALFSLNVSLVFPGYFLKGQEDNEFYSHFVVAEIFSCIATLGHLVEVWIMWIESNCYMATGPGLLQLCQTYIASAICFFLANTVSFQDHPAMIWSLTVYCVCFICTFVSIVYCTFQKKDNRKWIKGFSVLAAVMYLSASWPVFQLLSQEVGQKVCPGSCQDDLGLWPEMRLLVVVALTALNFFLYLLTLCCCCMLPSNDDEEGHNRSSSTSHLYYPQLSDETRKLLPAELTRREKYNPKPENIIIIRCCCCSC